MNRLPAHATLLAVDIGLKTGLALYGDDGRLRWYRSHNFGAPGRLKRAAFALLREEHIERIVLEGGGPLADIWCHEAQRRGIWVRRISAETWRKNLLLPRQQRSGTQAKQSADAAARRVIAWSGAPRPTALRHDAAEAILTGLWGVLDAGWLAELPPQLRP